MSRYLIRYALMISSLATVISTTMAQPIATTSLKELVDKVYLQSPTLVADSATLKNAMAQARETSYNWLPNLKLNAQANLGTNNNVPGGYFSYGIVPSNSKVQATNNNSTILTDLGIAEFDWEVYNFGKYGAQNKVAATEVKVANNRFAQTRYQLLAYTIDYYFQLLRYRQIMTIQQEHIYRNEQIFRSIKSLTRSGVKAGVDTSIASAELSNARLNAIEINNQAKQMQLHLSELSNIPYTQIEPDTTLEDELIQNAAAFDAPPDTQNHPLLQLYRSMYDNSLAKEKLIQKSYLPKMALQAAIWGRGSSIDAATNNYGSISDGWNFQRGNYLAGFGITYNIFDIKRQRLKLNEQRFASDYAAKKLNEQKTLLSIGNSRAAVELQTASERLREIPNQLNAANAAYRQKLSLYKSGLTDIIELNTTMNVLYRAEMDYATAKYTYCLALFRKAIVENQVDALLNLIK